MRRKPAIKQPRDWPLARRRLTIEEADRSSGGSLPRKHPTGEARRIAKTSAREAAQLAESRTDYIRGQMLETRMRIEEASARLQQRTKKPPDAKFTRPDREQMLRELRRNPAARPGASIPQTPRFIADVQRTTDAALRLQLRQSVETVAEHATAQARAMGLNLDVDRRAILDASKKAMNKRITRYAKRTAEKMWQDMRRETWRSVGGQIGSVKDDLEKRLKVYEGRIRRVIRTESNRAYNEQMLMAMEQMEEQNPGYRMFKRWDATMDKKVCASCRQMHGVTVPLREKFPPWKIDAPPLHSNCRCVLTTWPKKRHEEN